MSYEKLHCIHRILLPGDPTTPGFPAYENATRLEGGNVPQIPSLPISWNNGKRILEEINPTDLFKFDGTLSKRSIRLLNQVDNRVIPIWNTIGVIPGHIKDEIVVLGNHRDGALYSLLQRASDADFLY